MKPTLLVVEDELLVRMDLTDLAGLAGFEPLEAGSAAEAWEMLEARDDVQALFTDIRMPGTMDGLALAHQVRARWPEMPIVICSANDRPDPNDMPKDAVFLSKPCTGPKVEELLSAILAELR